jgi:preprotein translocase subunit SecG
MMAELRVERKKRGGSALLWILLAVVVLIVAAILLDRGGYVDVPGIGMVQDSNSHATLALSAPAH